MYINIYTVIWNDGLNIVKGNILTSFTKWKLVLETVVIEFASQGCGESAQCTCIVTAL